MFRGVSPSVLLSQVRSTVSWAIDGSAVGPERSWRAALQKAEHTEHGYEGSWGFLRLELAAHFATLGSFVSTDVDSHIRHHAWQRAHVGDTMRAALDVVDETDRWDPREISEKCVALPDGSALSGHDGEWLAVRAGALGRALAINDAEAVERIVTRIDAEIDRHALAWAWARNQRGRESDALRVATVIAHNLGDLSRVVVEWTSRSTQAHSLRERYARLGHDDGTVGDPRFLEAGRVNKAVMALENHRFLALREARSLRVSRELLMPISPFLDAWGETIARSAHLGARGLGGPLGGRAAVINALVETHVQSPTQQGVLRALAGFHHAFPGGLDAIADEVAARLRKRLKTGPIREAVGIAPERFEQRMANRFRAALEGRLTAS